MSTLVDESQSAYVPGRKIQDSLLNMLAAAEECNRLKVNAAVHMCDWSKAFDSLSVPFLLKLVKHLGLGDCIHGWLSAMYDGVEIRAKVRGRLGRVFTRSRGAAQGGPFSSLAFILCVQVLHHLLDE